MRRELCPGRRLGRIGCCALFGLSLGGLGGCSDDTQTPPIEVPLKKHDDAGLSPRDANPPPPIEIPPLGLVKLDQFFFSWGPAQLAYKQSSTAARQQNWKVASQKAQDAVNLNPQHLAAHWLLGESLAALEQFDAAVPELLRAVAGDCRRFGDKPLDGDHWNSFLRSTTFKQFDKTRGEIKERRAKFLAQSFLFVGSPRPSTETTTATTAGSAAIVYSRLTHAEVYAYADRSDSDRAAHSPGRFLRVSRTGGQTVAFIKSPNKKKLAVVSYSRATKTAKSTQIEDLAIEVIDATTGSRIGQRVQLGQAVLARIYFDHSRPGIMVERTLREENKTTTLAQRINWNHDRTWVTMMKPTPKRAGKPSLEISFANHRFESEGARQIDADWSQGKSDVIRLQKWRKTVVLPTEIVRDSLRFSPDGTKLVVSSPRCGVKPARTWIVFGATGRASALAETSAAAWKTSTQLVTNHQGQLTRLEIGGSQHILTQDPVIIGLNTYNLPCPPSAPFSTPLDQP